MNKLLLLLVVIYSGHLLAQVSPDSARKLLEAGNLRYVGSAFKSKDFRKDREEQSKGQKPYAIVLTCADSRVPPELIFDEGPGQIFVIRVAGNVVDEIVLGSIEYAAEHLHAQLLLVLGHTACGAVKATIQGGTFDKNIGSLVDRINPAVEVAKTKSADQSMILPMAIEENVELQSTEALHNSKILEELAEEGKFKILGGIYSIETGEVQFFEPSLKKPSHGPEKKEGVKKESPKKEKKEKSDAHSEAVPQHGSAGKYNIEKDRKITNTIFSDGEYFSLQVSSWQNRAKAESVANKYRKLYQGVFIIPYLDTATHKTWYRVRIGGFTSQHEAEEFASKVD